MKIPCFSLREGAGFWPADDDFTYNRLRSLAHRRLIHQRDRRGNYRTAPALFGVDDFAAAAALMALMDAGIADAEATLAASTAMYSWGNNPKDHGFSRPVSAAFIGIVTRAEVWGFQISTYLNEQTRERRVVAVLSPDGGSLNPMLGSGLRRITTLDICLTSLFMPFARAIQ